MHIASEQSQRGHLRSFCDSIRTCGSVAKKRLPVDGTMRIRPLQRPFKQLDQSTFDPNLRSCCRHQPRKKDMHKRACLDIQRGECSRRGSAYACTSTTHISASLRKVLC